MSSLNDRENAFETKFAHDAEMTFKAEMRRNKILAVWAAGLLKFDAERTAEYVKEVIRADFAEAGDEDVFVKLHGDLGDKVTEPNLRAQIAAALIQAQSELLNDN